MASVTTIAGSGPSPTGFGQSAARVDLRQATPGTRPIGRNQGVAVDDNGSIYVVSAATNQAGRIVPPAQWTMQTLGEVFTSPTGAMQWKFFSPSASASASWEATEYNGQSAIHWTAGDTDARTVLYVEPVIVAGADGRCTVTVVGSGVVCLNLYNGGVETFSQTVTLSDTPQTLVAQKVFSERTVQFKIRTPVAQSRVEVIAYGASIVQSQLTGDTTVVAGRASQAGSGGDGGPGSEAFLNAPSGVTVDSDGRVFLADTYNNRIRLISPTGAITTVAGTGEAGYDGDGPATQHQLNHPGGVAVDARGHVYVADTYNNRVRCIMPSGVIRTIAGTGEAGYGGDGGSASTAVLNHPQGIAVDSAGRVYVADTYNNRIRLIDANGRISTVAGTGVAGFSGDGGAAYAAQLSTPHDVEVAADGVIYIADTLNNRIRRVVGGTISTLAGTGVYGTNGRAGGPPSGAQFAEPLGVAVDNASGEVYVVESTHAVLRIRP
jgi:streptogramin lyase